MAKKYQKSKRWGRWTEDKIDELRKHYPNDSWDDLTDRFKVSKSELMQTASQFDIKRERATYSIFSHQEDDLITEYYNNGLSDKEISEMMPWRTSESIATRRHRLGIVSSHTWSQAEELILTEYYSTMPVSDMESLLPGRSRNAIVSHALKLGLTGFRNYDYYTESDLAFIRDNYLSLTDAEMGELLNHSCDSIKNKRNKMGLHRVEKGRTKYESFDVYLRRHNQEWKKKSMINCGYRCIISGDRFDDIHHLVSQKNIIDTVMRRWSINKSEFDINTMTDSEREQFLHDIYYEQNKHPLGVCLRHDIHMHFHKVYGFGDNTVEQFLEYVERFYPDVQLNIA